MTEVMQVREAYRVEQWRQLMQQRRESPLNIREFCAQQAINEKSYYYWLKKTARVRNGTRDPAACGVRRS